ncbi:MAG: AAA family ATPase, partial [Deltaproteobacteria bacterium]|nr:AAA family ATPase [Deltaproteobacteria bacterium]
LVEDQDGHPNVKIVDFGVAVRLKALPQQFGGTLAFIAPEVLARNGKLDHRVDLYSLGMMALFCLTHRLPFNAYDQEDVIEWHRSGSIPPSVWKGLEIPGYLREITEKLLAKNPSDRFSNSRVVLNFINLATGGRYRQEEEELQAQIPIEGPVVERREEVLRPLQDHMEKVLFTSEPEALSSVAFISGEAGIGKSRVVEEIRHVIQVKEIRFLQINCDWNIPSWPKLEQWLNLPASSGDRLDLDWQTRLRMDAILEAAKQAPICLLIDNFHKADNDLRGLVLALEGHTRKLRETGQAAPLFVLVATEEEFPESIRLPHLSSKGVLHYLKLVLGESIPVENLADILFRYSGGLPLLIVEGLRFLAPHFFRGESLENLLRPEKIHLLYEEKIKRLKPEEEELLLILALLFRSASEPELRQILEIESAGFAQLAENCLKLGLLSGNPYGEPIYHVSSQALALDLIGCLEPERRRLLHQKITRGFAKLPGIQLQELAYHSIPKRWPITVRLEPDWRAKAKSRRPATASRKPRIFSRKDRTIGKT